MRTQRAVRRLMQLALADALGVTFEQLKKREQGRSRIGARRLEEITRLLRMPAAALPYLGSKAERTRITDLNLTDPADAICLIRAYAALPTPRMKRALVVLAERMAGIEE